MIKNRNTCRENVVTVRGGKKIIFRIIATRMRQTREIICDHILFLYTWVYGASYMTSHVTLTVTSVDTCVSRTIYVSLYIQELGIDPGGITSLAKFFSSIRRHDVGTVYRRWTDASLLTWLGCRADSRGKVRTLIWRKKTVLNTRRSYSDKVTRRSFGGLSWPSERKRCNSRTMKNISTKFYRYITYVVRN